MRDLWCLCAVILSLVRFLVDPASFSNFTQKKTQQPLRPLRIESIYFNKYLPNPSVPSPT